MKKAVIAILLLLFGGSLLLSVSIKSIRAQDYNGVACRFVLDLDQDTDFNLIQRNNGFQIDIVGFDGKDAPRQINSKFIQELKITSGGVWLGTISGLKYEKMRFDDTKQIVLDMFKTVSSREERLYLARFYSDRGKYAKADELFAELNRDYPQDEEILDFWGILLKRMGSKRKLQSPAPAPAPAPTPKTVESPAKREVPKPESPAPREAAGKPQLPPQPGEESRFIELSVEEELDSLYQTDSLVTMKSLPPMRYEKISISEVITEMANRHFVLTILMFVGALVIIYVLLFGLKKKRGAPAQSPFEIKALHRMVGRLLADGWSHREIAQELKINVADVKAIADQPQQTEIEIADEPEAIQTPETEEMAPEPLAQPEPTPAEAEAEEGNTLLESILQEAAEAQYGELPDADRGFSQLLEEDTLEVLHEPEPYPQEPEPMPEIPCPQPAPEEPQAVEDTDSDCFRIFINESDIPVKKKK